MISIHALVKRATIQIQCFFVILVISIHALVKRATGSRKDLSKPKLYFNPRPREEGDI